MVFWKWGIAKKDEFTTPIKFINHNDIKYPKIIFVINPFSLTISNFIVKKLLM